MRGVAFDEFLLQICEHSVLGQAFDGFHRFSGNLRGQGQAAARGAPVDQHRAGAADAVLATEMGSGQLELLAQEIGQMLPRLDAAPQRLAVERRVDLDVFMAAEVRRAHAAALAARPPRTRRVSTLAR